MQARILTDRRAMARTVIHKVEGNKTYARCKGRPGHRWDDHPNYQREMHDWAERRMTFRCSECKMVKVYEQDSTGSWFVYYYDRPEDYRAVTADPEYKTKDWWSDEYYKAAFKNGVRV
jgi:hypothetical protein